MIDRKVFVSPVLVCILFLVLFAVLPVRGRTAELRILHVNDFHGFALPQELPGQKGLYGGMAFLAAKADELRMEKPSIFLAAGDMIQGNIWANFFEGKSVIEVMNGMKFDGMVVGNHEFDFGQKVLRELSLIHI